MATACVFDLNGTLLDLSALDPLFRAAFGDARARQLWSDQTLQLALVSTVTGDYRPFEELAEAALGMVAMQRGVTVAPAQARAILGGMRRLPAFPDVMPALEKLAGAGTRLAALTNSAPEAARAQVEFAGLAPYFEQVLSVDAVRRFKPAPVRRSHCRIVAIIGTTKRRWFS